MLSKLIPALKLVLLAAVAAFGCLLLWQLREFVKHQDQNATLIASQTSQLGQHADELLSQGDKSVAYLNGTITQVNVAVAQVNAATAGQIKTLEATNKEVLKASGRLSDLFGYLAEDLHGTKEHPGALPTMTVALGHVDEEIAALKPGIQSLNESMAKMPPILDTTADGVKQTDHVIGNVSAASDIALADYKKVMAPKRFALKFAEFVGGHFTGAFEALYYWNRR